MPCPPSRVSNQKRGFTDASYASSARSAQEAMPPDAENPIDEPDGPLYLRTAESENAHDTYHTSSAALDDRHLL